MNGAPPVVYLGPSLSLGEAAGLLSADFRPPVRRGDLPTLDGATTVVILDGEFGQSLSVSPKEILGLLDQGVRVIGGASMGALRAAELTPYGMEGVGWVFENYRSGRITGDDEVAVMFSPLSGRALTVPLVNVRFWGLHLAARGLIDARTSARMVRHARGIFFADRTPERLYEALEAAVGKETLATLLEATEGTVTDVKSEDARLALRRAQAPRRHPRRAVTR